MKTILEYIRYRKDILLSERKFNEVDALLFTLLGYVRFEEIPNNQDVMLSTACKNIIESLDKEKEVEYVNFSGLLDIVAELICAPRYKDVRLLNFKKVHDETQNIQFAVMTFSINDVFDFVTFRGTDLTMTGWKEDIMMLYHTTIPAYKLAQEYITEVIESQKKRIPLYKRIVRKKKLYVAGHSKGGNLAMASTIPLKQYHDDINKVYNYDGPGFLPEFYDMYDYESFIDKVTTYTPEDSIIGRMLVHREKYEIHSGDLCGMAQHDGGKWHCSIDRLCKVDNFTKHSNEVYDSILTQIMELDIKERKEYFDVIMGIIDKMEVKSVLDLNTFSLKSGIVAIKELSSFNSQQVRFSIELLQFLWKETRQVNSIK